MGRRGDLRLQRKSQSDLPFPVLRVSHLFCADLAADRRLVSHRSVAPFTTSSFSFLMFVKRFELPPLLLTEMTFGLGRFILNEVFFIQLELLNRL